MSDEKGTPGKGNANASVDVDAVTRISDMPEDEPTAEAEKTAPPPAQTAVLAATEVVAGTRVDAAPASGAEPTPSAGDAPASASGVDVDAATRVADRSYAKAPNTSAAPQTGIQPGSVLFGEYEIIEVLGAGGMGEVYKARHRRLGEHRAIKMMHAALSGKKGANEFFLREAKALLAVRHPAVVHCHDLLSDEEGRVFLIMEMIEGESLADRMEDGPLSADDVVRLGARLSAGLAAAHACGVVHRDISPDNIVLPGGDVGRAKLIDFGIAKILEEGQGTIVDGFKGKLSYASPEQLGFFSGKIDGRSDFYSLGLVLCAAARGRALGMGKTVVEAVDARRQFQRVPDDIPVGLRASIEPLLALDPEDRPTNAERLFGAPGQAAPEYRGAGTSAAAASEGGRSMLVPGIIAALALVAGVVAFVVVGEDPPAQHPAAAQSPLGTAPAQTLPAMQKPRAEAPAGQAAAPARENAAKPAPKATGPRALSPLAKMKIVGLLRGAETALKDDRLQSPKGDNAYEKYRAVLELDPTNEDARMGLVEVTSRYIALGRAALADGDVEKASGFVARAASITPHHPDLPGARAAIVRASSAN